MSIPGKFQDKFPSENTKEDRVKRNKIWREFDSTGTGEMTLSELSAAMKRVLKVDKEFTYVTKDIWEKSFNKAVQIEPKNRLTRIKFRTFIKQVQLQVELKDLFKQVEIDTESCIDKETFKKCLNRLRAWGTVELRMSEVDGQFNSIDVDGEGSFTMDQFADWVWANHTGHDDAPQTDDEEETQRKFASSRNITDFKGIGVDKAYDSHKFHDQSRMRGKDEGLPEVERMKQLKQDFEDNYQRDEPMVPIIADEQHILGDGVTFVPKMSFNTNWWGQEFQHEIYTIKTDMVGKYDAMCQELAANCIFWLDTSETYGTGKCEEVIGLSMENLYPDDERLDTKKTKPSGLGNKQWQDKFMKKRLDMEVKLLEEHPEIAAKMGSNKVHAVSESQKEISHVVKGKKLVAKENRRMARPFISTKWMPQSGANSTEKVRASIRARVDDSLRKLDVDKLDLLQIGAPASTPIKELAQELAMLVKEGKVKQLGVCNWSEDAIRDLQQCLENPDRGRTPTADPWQIATAKVEQSLMRRLPEISGLLTACREMNILVLASNPLDDGILAGDYDSRAKPHEPDHSIKIVNNSKKDKHFKAAKQKPEEQSRLMDSIQALAEKQSTVLGRKVEAAHIALNQVMSRGAVPLVQCKTLPQIGVLAGAFGFRLSKRELHNIGNLGAKGIVDCQHNDGISPGSNFSTTNQNLQTKKGTGVKKDGHQTRLLRTNKDLDEHGTLKKKNVHELNLDYYLNDFSDPNRFLTAWNYTDEAVTDIEMRRKFYFLICDAYKTKINVHPHNRENIKRKIDKITDAELKTQLQNKMNIPPERESPMKTIKLHELVKIKLGDGAPEELTKFLTTFKHHEVGPESQEKRDELWKAWDPNGNGQLSLAEVDGAIQKNLLTSIADENVTWKRQRPSQIRAFNDCKDAARATTSRSDDQVTRQEFRVLQFQLRLQATMWEVFALVDGGGPGVNANDDRKISKEEWMAAIPKLKKASKLWAPFLRLQTANQHDFERMDADQKGSVLLIEFCQWIKEGEIKGNTRFGKELSIGDDTHKK